MHQALTKSIIFLSSLLSGFFWTSAVKAVCPVCVVAVGAGLGLCRWLGVDDTISGLWIGALIMALVLWTLVEFRKKNWNFKYSAAVIGFVYYALIIWPLYALKIMGHPLNTVFGIDKLLFGIIIGTFVFIFSYWLNLYLKSKNQGKVYFPYQKVVIPAVVLFVFSLIFYLIIKCY